MAIKDRFIPKEEFMRLLFTKIDGVDTHDLSMWLKSKTDDEFVVVPFSKQQPHKLFFLNEAIFYSHIKPLPL
ncbi:MAG: hypothetical protein EB000_04280 [Alphaproteobacteria bacterium]|nr:hypothetical protein [Alphaproteobacteria bacterium]